MSADGSRDEDLIVTWEDASFTLNPIEANSNSTDPMWSSDASTPSDWFFYEE